MEYTLLQVDPSILIRAYIRHPVFSPPTHTLCCLSFCSCISRSCITSLAISASHSSIIHASQLFTIHASHSSIIHESHSCIALIHCSYIAFIYHSCVACIPQSCIALIPCSYFSYSAWSLLDFFFSLTCIKSQTSQLEYSATVRTSM